MADETRSKDEITSNGQSEAMLRSWTDVSICLAICLFAFAIRLIYLFQIESIPLFYVLARDSQAYEDWAQRIVAGDWLGQGVFYQAPLYPYFLAFLESIVGRDLWTIRVVQITLSAAVCSLLYLAGKSLFSRDAGIAAALLLSLYAPAIFFAGLIEKTAIDLFLVALMLVFLSVGEARGMRWLIIGGLLGMLGLSRENSLIWVFLIPLWIWFHFAQRSRPERLSRIASFIFGLALVLLPVGLRNFLVGGEFTLTTAQLGPNFFIGNNPSADGTYASVGVATGDKQFEQQEATLLAEQAMGRALTPGEVSSYWLGRSWNYIRSQPTDWLWLLWRKWRIVWNEREIEDSDDFYIYQKWSWLLTFLGSINHFGVLVPLAALGCVLTWKQRRKLWLLYVLLGTFAVSVTLFYVFGRYRFLLVPMLILFAGAGIVEVIAVCRERQFRRLLWCVAVLVFTGAFVCSPIAGKPGPSAEGYNNLAHAYAETGKIDEAIDIAQLALRVDPTYGVAHYNLGNLYWIRGRLDEAIDQYWEAIRIYPRFAEAYYNLGNVLYMRGELKTAIQHYREAIRIRPRYAEVRYNLGVALTQLGRLDEASEQYSMLLTLRPDDAEAHNNLGHVLYKRGNFGDAIKHYREALRIEPGFVAARQNLEQAEGVSAGKN